jgi:hypothetical protein
MQLLLRGELASHEDVVDVAAVKEELCSKDALDDEATGLEGGHMKSFEPQDEGGMWHLPTWDGVARLNRGVTRAASAG